MKEITDLEYYSNEDLTYRFHLKYGISTVESQYLFLQLKKFISFLARRNNSFDEFPIFQYQLIIDLYWHEFILDTKSYTEFCDKFFGFYVHHKPKTNKKHDTNIHTFSDLRLCINEAIRIAGIESATCWYYEIPEKFYWGNYHDNK